MQPFFVALAVSDSALLASGLCHKWAFSTYSYNIRSYHWMVCKVHVFAVYWLYDISSWLLVAVTFQRLIALRYYIIFNISMFDLDVKIKPVYWRTTHHCVDLNMYVSIYVCHTEETFNYSF